MSTVQFYVMYHATDSWENVEGILRYGFRRSNKRDNLLGHGVYVSRQECKTRNYGDFCLKLVVYTGCTRVIKRLDDPMRKEWHDDYDSAWVPPNCGMLRSGLEENCIENPAHITIVGMVRGYQKLPQDVRNLTRDSTGNISGVFRREKEAAQNLCNKLNLVSDYYDVRPGEALTERQTYEIPDFEYE